MMTIWDFCLYVLKKDKGNMIDLGDVATMSSEFKRVFLEKAGIASLTPGTQYNINTIFDDTSVSIRSCDDIELELHKIVKNEVKKSCFHHVKGKYDQDFIDKVVNRIFERIYSKARVTLGNTEGKNEPFKNLSGNIITYIKRIAEPCIYDVIKYEKSIYGKDVLPLIPRDSVDSDGDTSSVVYEDEINKTGSMDEDEKNRLWKDYDTCLSVLSDKEKRIWVNIIEKREKGKGISEILGISKASVTQTKEKARKKLERCMSSKGHELL